jgi:glycosyltransferase involved in cell wall biosynthesis
MGRITTVIGSLGSGGAERNLVRLSAALADRGWSVSLVTTDPAVEDFYQLPASVIRVRAEPDAHLSCRWLDVQKQSRRLAALRTCLRQTNPDLVISFLDTVNVSVLLALWRARIPVVVSERIDPRSHSVGIRWALLRRLTYPRAARVVVLTKNVAAWASRQWPPWQVESIPNPVFGFGAIASAVRPRGATRTILGLGRLSQQKGFDLLIRAFAMLAADFPGWEIQIAGAGPERDTLLRLARSLGIGDRVKLIGVVRDTAAALEACDLFVLPSRYEGFPNALSEAMSVGLPVISFDCPSGPSELIRHDVDGLLVPPRDIVALAGALRRLMADPEERARLAARAPEVVRRFDAESVFDQWQRLVVGLLGQAGSSMVPELSRSIPLSQAHPPINSRRNESS